MAFFIYITLCFYQNNTVKYKTIKRMSNYTVYYILEKSVKLRMIETDVGSFVWL